MFWVWWLQKSWEEYKLNFKIVNILLAIQMIEKVTEWLQNAVPTLFCGEFKTKN